ncbi:barstar family protein [Streptomyces sp. BRA346]|uniref:barstar family protein n=1 Tax=Streptomyces sp. BRA346 TaxID=2878199 RepID=UPI00406293E0
MNGTHMGTLDGVFQSFYDAFRLPDYFGWNLPALNDCLRDLRWISADQYVLLIEEAQDVLSEEREDLAEFLSILARAGEKWSYAKHPGVNERAAFQVVLECGEEGLSRMSEATSHLL